MPITFLCACGQSITVRDDFAGKMGRCPKCKQAVQVPGPAGAPAPPPVATPTTGRPRPMAPPPPAAPPTNRAMPRPMAPPAPAGRPTGRPGAKTPRLLIVTAPGNLAGSSFPLAPGRPTVVGRDTLNDVPIPSERISRRHCQIEPTADGMFVLVDLGSSNGTLVNREKIQGRKVLMGGEYIQIGDVLLQFADS